jgi:cysteine synthase B
MQKHLKESILGSIGNTPLLKVYETRGVEIYAKAECFNPGGSVKDRPALRMIEEGERSGELTRGKIILEATSGNMGIALAMIGAVKGYGVLLVMPENVSEERKRIIKAYGAKMVLTDPLEGIDGAIIEARRIYESGPQKYFYPDQYNSPFNPLAHYETTGPEIIEQTQGKVTHFVAGIGTGGTIMGAGRRLKEFNREIKLIAIEPAEPLHGIEGLKHMASSIVPGIYDESFLDWKVEVETEEAYEMARLLAKEKGLLVGQSSGAALVGALEVAKQVEKGVIVTVFPDGGDRYLTTPLWIQA